MEGWEGEGIEREALAEVGFKRREKLIEFDLSLQVNLSAFVYYSSDFLFLFL